MNHELNGHRRPNEGDRLGGTLAEGRLANNNGPQDRIRNAGINTPLPPPPMEQRNNARDGGRAHIHSAKSDVDRPSGVLKGLEGLHFDHRVWLNALRFYREELFIFQRHLEKFVRVSATPDIMAHVEQYQNRLLRQCEVIDELAHEIKEHDQRLATYMSDGSAKVVYRPFGVHNELREKYEIFERLYHELKNEFRQWLAYNR